MSVSIFFCYAHEDKALLKKLKAHLRPLQRQGLITVWYDGDISAGTEWEQQIKEQLNSAQITLLLVSPDFMDSDYCYSIEMQRALERHQRGEARVIPIIMRPVYWQGILGHLQALPTDAKPVMSAHWHNVDEAFFDVTEGIRTVVAQLSQKPVSPPEVSLSQASKQESAGGSLTVLTSPPVKPVSQSSLDRLTRQQLEPIISSLQLHQIIPYAKGLWGESSASGEDFQTEGKVLKYSVWLTLDFDETFDNAPHGVGVLNYERTIRIRLWGDTLTQIRIAGEQDGNTDWEQEITSDNTSKIADKLWSWIGEAVGRVIWERERAQPWRLGM